MDSNFPRAYDYKKAIAPSGFKNINDLCDLSEANWLHPVQSLFGKWGGKILILGQDYDGLNNLNGFQASDFRHDANFETNKSLIKVFGENADAFYANFFWFIKEGRAQDKFSARREVVDANRPIFESTVKAMENLSHIFSMGELTTKKAFGIGFNPLVETIVKIVDRSYVLMPIPHLGNRGLGNFSRKHSLTKLEAITRIRQAIVESLKNSL